MGTVLIVEDHYRSRDLLKNLVEKEGRAVVTAGDGRDGLECARRIPSPSLILLDLSMPRMNGWEFLRHKTADPTIAGIPTIVWSRSFGDVSAGAMSALAKPVDVESPSSAQSVLLSWPTSNRQCWCSLFHGHWVAGSDCQGGKDRFRLTRN